MLLAAGRGTRFGSGKLNADLGGKPVLRHAADMLRTFPFAAHIAVVGPATPDPGHYTTITLDPPDAPQARSLAQGVIAARASGAEAVLVALADMPLVPAAHIAALIASFDGDHIASMGPQAPMPPALFGAQYFDALAALSGDRGAGALLRDAPFLPLTADQALDIDRPEDLARAAELLG